ncbi:MAG: O-antigen ligase family protein [Mycobacteriales bacterium]
MTLLPVYAGGWFRVAVAGLAAAAFVGIYAVLEVGGNVSLKVAEGGLGVLVVLAVSRRPTLFIAITLAFLPFQQVLLSLAYHDGLPAAIVRPLGFLKEAATAGALLAAAWHARRARHRWDRLDWLATAYVVLLIVYLLAPFLHPGLLGNRSFYVRLLAWRTDALFALLFLASRHLPWSPGAARAAVRTVITAGTVVAALGVVNVVDSHAWNHFLVATAGLPRYDAAILHNAVNPNDVLDHGQSAGHGVIRAGSTLLYAVVLGFYLLVPLSIQLERLTRLRLRATTVISAALLVTAIVLTLTRSAVLGAMLAAVVVLALAVRARAPGRTRLALLLAVAVVAALPLAASAQLTGRILDKGGHSNSGHILALERGFDALVANPLGNGLGTAPGLATSYANSSILTSENAYLQVGNEVGVFTLAAFVAFLVGLLMALRSAAAARGWGHALAVALTGELAGILLAGMFLHVWLDLTQSMSLMGLAGIALNVDRCRAPARTRPPYGRPLFPR